MLASIHSRNRSRSFAGSKADALFAPFLRSFFMERPKAHAKGGVVSSPTLFPMQSGLGLMGEAGAEAILPLRRGADGSLGVAAPAGAGQGVSVVMNITTPDARSFALSENQIAIKLARAVGRGRRGL